MVGFRWAWGGLGEVWGGLGEVWGGLGEVWGGLVAWVQGSVGSGVGLVGVEGLLRASLEWFGDGLVLI